MKSDGEKQAREETEQLERRAEVLRHNVDLWLAEADRRRHAAVNAVNVKRQLVLHPGVALGIAGTVLALAIGLPILGVRRARKRRTLAFRAAALRQALGRMIRRPDRVAENPPHLPKKVLTGVAVTVATTLARKQIERLMSNRRRRDGALSPA
jgi:hypothetical protein